MPPRLDRRGGGARGVQGKRFVLLWIVWWKRYLRQDADDADRLAGGRGHGNMELCLSHVGDVLRAFCHGYVLKDVAKGTACSE